jgi:hypothetical protein
MEGKRKTNLQLIDGLIHYDERMSWFPFTDLIIGDGSAVDMCLTLVNRVVEATIQVAQCFWIIPHFLCFHYGGKSRNSTFSWYNWQVMWL